MRIVVLSDQHGELPDIPPCDLLILSGDLTGGNPIGPRDHSEGQWNRWLHCEFAQWIDSIQAEKIVAIGGNHDTVFEKYRLVCGNVDYLCDSGTEYRGLKIWGTPWIREWGDLVFNATGAEIIGHWGKIPDDTDILVTHMPPFGVCDGENGRNLGCEWLTQRIQQVQPKLVTCGHIHGGVGVGHIGKSIIVNAARKPVELSLE